MTENIVCLEDVIKWGYSCKCFFLIRRECSMGIGIKSSLLFFSAGYDTDRITVCITKFKCSSGRKFTAVEKYVASF